jgi:hypothetical protein
MEQSMIATHNSMSPFIEIKNMPVLDENGHMTTYGELAKRYRLELETRSKYWKNRWWDNLKEAEKKEGRRRHKAL